MRKLVLLSFSFFAFNLISAPVTTDKTTVPNSFKEYVKADLNSMNQRAISAPSKDLSATQIKNYKDMASFVQQIYDQKTVNGKNMGTLWNSIVEGCKSKNGERFKRGEDSYNANMLHRLTGTTGYDKGTVWFFDYDKECKGFNL